jgi:hypothetical protein
MTVVRRYKYGRYLEDRGDTGGIVVPLEAELLGSNALSSKEHMEKDSILLD